MCRILEVLKASPSWVNLVLQTLGTVKGTEISTLLVSAVCSSDLKA